MRQPAISVTFPALLLAVLSYLLYITVKFLSFYDISERPIAEMPPLPYKTHLVTYTNDSPLSEPNRNALVYSALLLNIKSIYNYKMTDIESNIADENSFTWIAEPTFILQTLENIPDNEFVIYADTSYMLKENILPLLELADKNDIITNDEGFGIYKNTPKVREFVSSWINNAKAPSMPSHFNADKEQLSKYLYKHNRNEHQSNHDHSLIASLMNQQGKLSSLELAIYNSDGLAQIRQLLAAKYPLLQMVRNIVGEKHQQKKEDKVDIRAIINQHMKKYQNVNNA